METLSPDEQLTASLIDALPEAVLLYVPMFGAASSGTPSDFRLMYCNEEVTRVVGLPRDMMIGQTVQTTHLFDEAGREHTFRKLLEVWVNDSRQTESYYHAKLNLHLEAIRKKAMGGVVVITRDRTTEVQAEAVLLDKERKFRSIIDTSQDGVLVLEPVREVEAITDFRVSFGNAYALEAGRMPEDAVGRTLLELYPQLKGSNDFDLHRTVVETGEPVRFETAFYDQDGAPFGWFIVSLTWVNDVLISRFTDISEQKAYEQEVEAQRDLLKSIQDASHSSLFAARVVFDAAGNAKDLHVVKVNEAFTRVNGVKAEQIEGQSFLSFFPKTRQTGIFYAYCKVAVSKVPYQGEIYYDGEGMDGWFDVNAVPWGSHGVVVSFSDVSEQKRSRLQIEQAALYLQQMIDVAPTGIFTLTPVRGTGGEITDFRFKSANRVLAAYVNQQPAALVGGLHDDWFPGYKSNGTFEIYKRIAEDGGEERFERHYKDEQVEVWVDVTVKGVDGDVLVSFHDFTGIKRLQLQLESMVEQLRRSNENLEEFAYVASHDLQEPLRKVNLFAANLESTLSGKLDAQQSRSFERMRGAVQRMRCLIEDLLLYAQSGRSKSDPAPVDLNDSLRLVIQDLDASVQESGAQIMTGGLPTVTGDEQQLRQMLQNLVSNAIKYRRAGVRPEVRLDSRIVHRGDPMLLQFPGATAPSYHLVTVSDNGIGFEQHYAEKIFKVFQRLHGNTEYQGTGVGLSIVKKVVENHGGCIAAIGEPEAGATFLLLFPVSV
ncbi:MAG: PAS domain-containing protein [Sphingobacteriales bacterium]|nr:MAG: PAS domain-containing protein [Sphingobacteriales bacterium]